MSKYTTQLRYIVENYANDSTLDIDDQIKIAREKIFNFDYPIWNEEYREVLESKIISHYYTREIGSETYGLFKLRLKNKLREIMPYYNQLYESTTRKYDFLNDVDLKETLKGKNTQKDNSNSTFKNDSSEISESNSNASILFSDYPQNHIGSTDYATNLNESKEKNEIENINSSSGNNNGNYNSDKTNEYVKNIKGKTGGISYSDMLLKYRETLINIDMMIINDLSDLFMLIY